MVGAPPANRHTTSGILTTVVAWWCLVLPTAWAADDVSPAILLDAVSTHASQLASVDSNAAAMALFTSTIGPSLGLHDVVGILNTRGLSPQTARELGLSELSQSVHQLMAALAIWQLAESIYLSSSPAETTGGGPPSLSRTRLEWLNNSLRFSGSLELLNRLASSSPSTAPASSAAPSDLVVVAMTTAREAQRQALTSWWSLREWKHRARQARGLSRLCGTWQWIIHNHQNHQEQKLTMVFPPPGQTTTENPLPVETIVLGDSIYLRWEDRGFVQEDSLLFVTEGHKRDGKTDAMKIEGSFLNNRGGWGPISGKRLAPCPSGL